MYFAYRARSIYNLPQMNNITNNRKSRTTYFEILQMSEEYIKAFQILNKKNNNRITNLFHVKFYLLAHSIELSLKAYLRYKKYTLSDLKYFGHNLNKIYKELTSKFIYKLDSGSVTAINSINSYYKNKEFEYPANGTKKNVTSLAKLSVIAKMILEATKWQIQTEDNS